MKPLLAIISFLIPFVAHGQQSDFQSPNESELVGYWQIIEVPDEKQPGKTKNKSILNGEPCNVQIYRNDGTYATISSRSLSEIQGKAECELRKDKIDLAVLATKAFSSAIKWKQKFPEKSGLFEMEVQGEKIFKLLWIAQQATQDISTTQALGFNLKKGDIVMNLMRIFDGDKMTAEYRLVLRRIPN